VRRAPAGGVIRDRRVRVAVLVVAAGCGRAGFDPIGDGGAAGDGPISDGCSAHAAAIFCDGFEGGLAAWEIVDGTPARTTALLHAGTGALEAAIQDQPEAATVQRLLPQINTLGELYLRGWFYAPSSFSFGQINVFNIDSAAGSGVSIYTFNENLAVFRRTGSETGGITGPPLPKDGWHCVELALVVADSGGRIALHVDGQNVIDQTNLDTLPTGGFDRLNVGIPFSGSAQVGPATVYLDDIVVDVTPIGCAP
jgi:hypothetical protein